MFEDLFKKSKLISNFSKIFATKYGSVFQSDYDYVDGMFPRVIKHDFSDVELTMFCCNDIEMVEPEFLENVIDKFLRAIDPFVEEDKMISVC